VASIPNKIGASADMFCGHKEYAPGRKIDPILDMDQFRERVSAIMSGTAGPATLIAAADSAGRPTLRRGDCGDLVKRIQTLVSVDTDGIFGPTTEAAVRQFQLNHGLVPDGIAGPRTWAVLETP